jgi:Protein of unknown function (DUF3102)
MTRKEFPRDAKNLTTDTNAQTWAARISERWRASVEAIIEVGRLLTAAKAALPHGEFGSMIANSLPFSTSTAQLLPASWGTLYELTKLSDEEFDQAREVLLASFAIARPCHRVRQQLDDANGVGGGRMSTRFSLGPAV